MEGPGNCLSLFLVGSAAVPGLPLTVSGRGHNCALWCRSLDLGEQGRSYEDGQRQKAVGGAVWRKMQCQPPGLV